MTIQLFHATSLPRHWRGLAGAALLACTLAAAACSAQSAPVTAPQAGAETAAPKASAALPRMIVHKDPNCGCCNGWIEHMRRSGFEVEARNSDDMGGVKERAGVPYGKGSCHTAEVGGYFIEGHVPADDVKRLLAEKPDALGLTLPGMPAGSPGMEMPDGRVQPYIVELVERDGSTREFSRHGF